jgi:hypothetical protein
MITSACSNCLNRLGTISQAMALLSLVLVRVAPLGTALAVAGILAGLTGLVAHYTFDATRSRQAVVGAALSVVALGLSMWMPVITGARSL